MDELNVGGTSPGESLDHALTSIATEIAETAQAAEPAETGEESEGSGASADPTPEQSAAQSAEAAGVASSVVIANELRTEALEARIRELEQRVVEQQTESDAALVAALTLQVQAEPETPLDTESTLGITDTASNESPGVLGTGDEQREPDQPPKRDHWWWRKLFN